MGTSYEPDSTACFITDVLHVDVLCLDSDELMHEKGALRSQSRDIAGRQLLVLHGSEVGVSVPAGHDAAPEPPGPHRCHGQWLGHSCWLPACGQL